MISFEPPLARIVVSLGENRRGRQGPGTGVMVWRGRIQVKQYDGWG